MTATIFVAEDKYHPIPGLTLTAPERFVAQHWEAFGRLGMPTGLDESRVARADVRQGRWEVACPWCDCRQFASPEDRRFFCTICSNGAVGGKWIRVQWPPDREGIDAVIGMRSHPDNRNWLPGESLTQLRNENREHGVAA